MKKHLPFPSFTIEGLKPNSIFESLKFEILSESTFDSAYKFLYDESDDNADEKKLKAIISDQIDNWTLVYLRSEIDDNILQIMERLTKESSQKINYHSADSVVGDFCWIIAENHKIKRHFNSCWTINSNMGNPINELETAFINSFDNDEFVFGEDVCLAVFKDVCGLNLKEYPEETKFHFGYINLE